MNEEIRKYKNCKVSDLCVRVSDGNKISIGYMRKSIGCYAKVSDSLKIVPDTVLKGLSRGYERTKFVPSCNQPATEM